MPTPAFRTEECKTGAAGLPEGRSGRRPSEAPVSSLRYWRGRIAYLIKPTGKVDPQKRWLFVFPFWLAINDGFGNVAHRYYVEKALAAGFHIAGVDVGPSCGSPAAAKVCQEFYEQLVSRHGLHKRARLLAHSHSLKPAVLFMFATAAVFERCLENRRSAIAPQWL